MELTAHPAVSDLVDTARAESGFSGRVLLTTIFGDALLPRRQEIAVLQLAALVEPIGVSDRLVRTSLLRLTRDALVTSERRGRQSFYRVHPDAETTFGHANARIYGDAGELDGWDGQWTIAVLDNAYSPAEDPRLTDELRWLGMSEYRPGVHVSPTVPTHQLKELEERLELSFAVLMSGPLAAGSLDSDSERLRHADPDGRLRELHEAHRLRFEPLVDVAPELSAADAFTVRTLLIDGWRRIALRSPLLPRMLLPADWPAFANAELTRELHGALFAKSERHLTTVLEGGVPAVSLFERALRSAG